jgi:integrase
MARVTGRVFLVDRKSGPQWYAKYRLPSGKQVQKRLGPVHTGRGRCPAGSYTRTARDALEAILTDARRGTLENAARASSVTFADAAAEYLRYIADVRKRERSTLTDYASVINSYLLAAFGHMSLEAITADHIDAYKERLLAERRLGNRTVVRHLTVLHGIFRRAARVWGLQRNPASADLVERPPVRYSGEFKTLRPGEVLQLARHADGRQDAALYLTAAFTGLRMGELLALRWRDVDFALQRLHVRRNYTDRREKAPKSGRVRSAPIVDEVTAALDALTRRAHFTSPDDPVFPNEVGEHLCGWTVRRRFYAALDAAGLPRLRFHDLRHCFATIAVQRLPLHTVQGYLGHAHISTTMRYVHHTPAARDVALLSDASRAETVLISGHARDTPAAINPPHMAARDGAEPNEEEAPTGIEPVTSSSRAVERNLLDWAELQAARAVSVYRPLFEPGGGV